MASACSPPCSASAWTAPARAAPGARLPPAAAPCGSLPHRAAHPAARLLQQPPRRAPPTNRYVTTAGPCHPYRRYRTAGVVPGVPAGGQAQGVGAALLRVHQLPHLHAHTLHRGEGGGLGCLPLLLPCRPCFCLHCLPPLVLCLGGGIRLPRQLHCHPWWWWWCGVVVGSQAAAERSPPPPPRLRVARLPTCVAPALPPPPPHHPAQVPIEGEEAAADAKPNEEKSEEEKAAAEGESVEVSGAPACLLLVAPGVEAVVVVVGGCRVLLRRDAALRWRLPLLLTLHSKPRTSTLPAPPDPPPPPPPPRHPCLPPLPACLPALQTRMRRRRRSPRRRRCRRRWRSGRL